MDARLRELERRWAQTGATADEAALLRERVRLGDLDRGRLDLAAHAGYVAALQAGGAPAPDPELAARLRGLDRWGREALARGCLALTAAVIPHAPVGPTRDACDALQAAAEAWVVGDGAEGVGALLRVLARLQRLTPQTLGAQLESRIGDLLRGVFDGLGQGGAAAVAASAQEALQSVQRFTEDAFAGLRALQTTRPESVLLVVQWAAQVLLEAEDGPRPAGHPDPVEMAVHFVGRLEGALPAAEAGVAREVGVWALGYHDPLAIRVAGRRAGPSVDLPLV